MATVDLDPTAAPPPEEPTGDWRRARGEKTKAAIVEAVVELYSAGNLTPRIDDIAEHVGVTPRTIYHHFADSEALAVAVGQRQLELHGQLMRPAPATGTVGERIEAVAAHRAELYEAIAPVRRAAVIGIHRSPVVASQQRAVGRILRTHLADTFADELGSAPGSRLEALDVVTSWETWDRLRSRQDLGLEEARGVTVELMSLVLTSGR